MSYHPAINKEFKTTHGETEHLGKVGITHHPNNNHVERLHGTIREREKIIRGVKKKDSKIIEGHRLYYNFIKPHEGLGGKTPSEKAGILEDIFSLSQLIWSAPKKCSRIPITIKLADEFLRPFAAVTDEEDVYEEDEEEIEYENMVTNK